MARIVGAFAVPHAGMIIRRYDPAQPAQARIHSGFEQLRGEIEALAPDLIVMVSSEHLNSFFYDCLPQVCIGLGNRTRGWGDAGVESREVVLAGDFAAHLLESGIAAGFDLAFSAEPKLDHGFMCPLALLTPAMDVPIVPIFLNSSTPPLSPFRRCAELGVMLGQTIRKRPGDERVVLLAAGGLSHWIGTERMGEVAIDFDRWFLGRIAAGDLESLAALDLAEVEQRAGNGGQEIRNWVTVMAAAGGPGKALCYEPIGQWVTGMALARFAVT